MGPKTITWISLALATGACFILSKESLLDDPSSSINLGNEHVTQAVRHFLFFSDSAIAGYLLICLSIALLAMASLEEVLQGTENKLLRTKFIDASNLHLFVESAFVVLTLVQICHVIGPIIGGFINTLEGMSQACVQMGFVGGASLFLYTLGAIWVQCTVHKENSLALDISGSSRQHREY